MYSNSTVRRVHRRLHHRTATTVAVSVLLLIQWSSPLSFSSLFASAINIGSNVPTCFARTQQKFADGNLQPDEYPWFTAVLDEEELLLCSGALIGQKYVVTASLCGDRHPSAVMIGYRCDDEDNCGGQQGEILAVTETHVTGDLSLLTLERGPTSPINLAMPDLGGDYLRTLRKKHRLKLVGGGRTERYYGPRPVRKQTMKFLGPKKCEKKFGFTQKAGSLCTIPVCGGPCPGDGGGALVAPNSNGQDVVVGVLTLSPGFTPNGCGSERRVPEGYFSVGAATNLLLCVVCHPDNTAFHESWCAGVQIDLDSCPGAPPPVPTDPEEDPPSRPAPGVHGSGTAGPISDPAPSLPEPPTGPLPWSEPFSGPLPEPPSGPLAEPPSGPLPQPPQGPLPEPPQGPPPEPPQGPLPQPPQGPSTPTPPPGPQGETPTPPSGITPDTGDPPSGPVPGDPPSGVPPSGPVPGDPPSGVPPSGPVPDPPSGPVPEDPPSGPVPEDPPSGPVPEDPPSGPVPGIPPSGPVPGIPPPGPVPEGPSSGPVAPSGPAPEGPPSGPVPEGPPSGPVPGGVRFLAAPFPGGWIDR